MVAKSFQEYEVVSEVYEVNGRAYIKVKHPRTGNVRQVRFYTEAEYAKLYPETVSVTAPLVEGSQRRMLGFQKGYITIFKGNTEEHEEWFNRSNARYTRFWGWYVVSTEEVPKDLPFGIVPVQLRWEDVGVDETLKPEGQVKAAVENALYEPNGSIWIGTIGERREFNLTVTSTVPLETNFGHSTMHIMEDEAGNQFVWTTASKNWGVGTYHEIRGTIKDHRTYKGAKQTILTRCNERAK